MIMIKKHLPLFFALVFAGLSSVSISYYLEKRENILHAKPEATLPVVVAGHDLPMGMKILEQDVTVQQWPKDIVTDQYFQSPRQIVGRTLRSGLVASEPVTAAKLLGSGENLSMLIPPNMRAVAVSVRRSNTLARVLEPGSTVDVVAILGDQERMNTKVIARGVRVLAVDNSSGPENALDKTPKTEPRFMEVMLLVPPRDADWIVYARNQGDVDLVLRNENTEAATVSVA